MNAVRTLRIVDPNNIGRQILIRETIRDGVTSYHKQKSIDVRPEGGSLTDYIHQLQDAAEGLGDATIDGEAWDDYGSTTWTVTIEGWLKASPDEVAAFTAEAKALAAQQKTREDADIERLRKARPELFKS